jgi:hypothetical protein
MAEANTDPTRTSSPWLSIIKGVFPRWCDRLGLSRDAGQALVNLLCDADTRTKMYRVDASGEEISHTVSSPDIEFWPGRLVLVPDPDGGDDHLEVSYGDELLDFHDPGGHWEFDVRRIDVERWERLYPALAAPPSTAAASAVSEIATQDVSHEAQGIDADGRPTANPSTVTTVRKPRQSYKETRVIEVLRDLDGEGRLPYDLEHQPAQVEKIVKPHYGDASRRVIGRAYQKYLKERSQNKSRQT